METGAIENYLFQWQNQKGATASSFNDNGHKFGIDSAKVRVPGVFRDANVIVAVVALQSLPENVPKLAVTNDSARRHL